MNMPNLAVQALALTVRHLKQFGLERILHLGASFRPLSCSTEMTLSANALQQLEVSNSILVLCCKEVCFGFPVKEFEMPMGINV